MWYNDCPVNKKSRQGGLRDHGSIRRVNGVSMDIIDINSHIMNGIDDGAGNIGMSLELMEMEYDQGVRGIFLTGHGYGMEAWHEDYGRRFDELVKISNERFPGLSLYKGSEILCYRDFMDITVDNIKSGIFPTLNGGDHVLIEFNPYDTEGTDEMRFCAGCLINNGLIPIIAHVERYYDIFADPVEDLKHLKDLGCLAQINLYSIDSEKNASERELADLFLTNRLADFVGTDAHRPDHKRPDAARGAKLLAEKYGLDYASEILYKNAKTILIGWVQNSFFQW